MYSGDEYYGDEVTSPIERPAQDPIAHRYAAWLDRVDAILDSNYGIETWDIAYGWYAAFVAGTEPGIAVEAAIAELRRHGMLDATLAPHVLAPAAPEGAE